MKKVDSGASSKLNLVMLFLMLVFIIVVILVIYVNIDKNNNSFESTDIAMGTYVNQTIYGGKSEEIAKAGIKRVNELESLLSWRIENSDIYKINKNAGKDWVDIDDKTLDVLEKCIDASKRSFGAFDMTLLPLTSLWDFDSEINSVPTYSEISDRLGYVGYKNLRLNHDVKRAKFFKENCGIDLGSVGKGAACDDVIEIYKNQGARGGIVAVGGSIGVYGTKPNNADWRIAIRDPYEDDENVKSLAILEISRGCVSTSGIYEKSFDMDGNTYHHILDPKTGYPVDNDLLSVTVWHESGIMTDILATACCVLGKENSSYLLGYYGAGAVFVDKGKNIYVTSNLKENILLTNEEYNIYDYE